MERWTERAFWAGCGLLAAFGITALALPHQLTYAEGYMLEQAARLAQGGDLYRTQLDPPWVLDNFPPLWTAVLAVGVKLFGPTFQWGRGLSLLATVGLTWLLFAFHRMRGDARWGAFGAGALWLLAPFVLWRSLVVRMDLPALLLAALGFWVYLAWSDARPRRALLVAGTLLSAAALARQTMLVAPVALALGAWSIGRRRHAFGILLVTGTLVTIAVVTLQTLTEGAFLRHVVLYNTGRYSLEKLALMSGRLVLGQGALLVLGGIGAWSVWKRGPTPYRLLAVWAVLEVFASVTVGKPGAAVNHYLPLLFLLAVHAGPGAETVGRWWAARKRRQGKAHVPTSRPIVAVVALQLLLVPVPAGVMVWHVVGGQDEEARLVDRLRDEPGPIMSENAGAALQAGHDVVLEPRLVLEQYAAGRWEDDALVDAIGRQEYSLIVTQDFLEPLGQDGFRFTERAWDTLQVRYQPVETIGEWQVWEPR